MVAGSTIRTPGWSGSTTQRPRRGSRRRRPSRAPVLDGGAGTRLAAGSGRSLGAPCAAVAADSAPDRTDASSSGRRMPTTTSSSSCCGAARRRRSRRCSTRTPGRATRCWCSPCRRPTARWSRSGRPSAATHDAVIHVLDVETGRLLPDRPRGTNHESVAWRPDSSGFFYAASPEPGEVPAGEEALWDAVYEHRLGSAAPARRVFGDDRVKDVLVLRHGQRVRPLRACSYKWDFVHANVVYLLRLADDALRAGGSRDAVGQSRAGDRRAAARPDRSRRAARPSAASRR